MKSIIPRVSLPAKAKVTKLRGASSAASRRKAPKFAPPGRVDLAAIPAFLRRGRGSAPRTRHSGSAEGHSRLHGLMTLVRRPEVPLGAIVPERALHRNAASPDQVMQTMRQFAGRYLHAEEPHRAIIGIVSPTSGDGRSTLAMGLASALVDMYSSVLLVETQVGRHRREFWGHLHIQEQPGLREFLDDGLKLDDIIRRTGKENLWLLPAGNVDDPKALSLDDVSRLHPLLAQLNELFAVVLVDLPPLLESEAAPVLLDHVNAAVMVAAAQRTTTSDLNQALTLCGSLPLRGLLLNKERTRTPRWVESLALST